MRHDFAKSHGKRRRTQKRKEETQKGQNQIAFKAKGQFSISDNKGSTKQRVAIGKLGQVGSGFGGDGVFFVLRPKFKRLALH